MSPNSEENLMKPSILDCISIANSLITRCNLLVPHVNDVAGINSGLIVALHEKITGLAVPDLISGEGNEAHNIQAVINSLSLDILQLSLSHISGEAVVAGDALAIYNLLHVLEGILLHSSINSGQTFPKRKISQLKRREVHISKETISKQTVPLQPLDAEKLFEKNAELKLQTALIKNRHSSRSKSFLRERSHLQHMMTQPLNKSTHPRPCHKSFLLPYALRKKHSSHPPLKKAPKEKYESSEKEERKTQKAKRGHHHPLKSPTHFIQELLDEFPCIQISPSLMKNIENMYAHQLIRMQKLMKKCLFQKSKAAVEAEDISKRQLKLAEILKKDMVQQKYLNEVREEKENERKIRYVLRDSRIQSAKMKQYTDEFVLEMRKKMMNAASTAEELIFKRVFKEVMDMQNEHVNDLCQQVRETRMNDDECYLNYLNSLENLYQSQYLALSEEIANERNDAQLRLKAEREAFSKTEREFREKLKREIRFMQKVIVDQTEDCHFREMDANLYVEEKRKQLRQ